MRISKVGRLGTVAVVFLWCVFGFGLNCSPPESSEPQEVTNNEAALEPGSSEGLKAEAGAGELAVEAPSGEGSVLEESGSASEEVPGSSKEKTTAPEEKPASKEEQTSTPEEPASAPEEKTSAPKEKPALPEEPTDVRDSGSVNEPTPEKPVDKGVRPPDVAPGNPCIAAGGVCQNSRLPCRPPSKPERSLSCLNLRLICCK